MGQGVWRRLGFGAHAGWTRIPRRAAHRALEPQLWERAAGTRTRGRHRRCGSLY